MSSIYDISPADLEFITRFITVRKPGFTVSVDPRHQEVYIRDQERNTLATIGAWTTRDGMRYKRMGYKATGKYIPRPPMPANACSPN